MGANDMGENDMGAIIAKYRVEQIWSAPDQSTFQALFIAIRPR